MWSLRNFSVASSSASKVEKKIINSAHVAVPSCILALYRGHVRGGEGGGAGEALTPQKFGGSEKGTEREIDNLQLLAPPESKS